MDNNIGKNGVPIELIEYNGDLEVGPALLSLGKKNTSPTVSGKEGISQSGDSNLIERIKDIIAGSREFICLSSYLIQNSIIIEEIKKCAKRNVRVYIMTAAENRVENPDEDDTSSIAEIKKASRELLVQLASVAHIKSGENLHSKFILSDPKTDPKGMVFTSNLTKRALEENIELAIELSKDEVLELFRQFVSGFWKLAVRTLYPSINSPNYLRVLKPHPEFISGHYTPKNIKWTIGEECLIRDKLLEIIESAKESISVSAWTIDATHPVSRKIIEKAKNGISVTIFSRPHPSNAAFMGEIVNLGGKVYCHELLHAKSLIVDGKHGVIMTANISKLGLDEGFETAVILNKKQVEVIKRIHEEWKKRVSFESFKHLKLKEAKSPRLDLSKNLTELSPPGEYLEIKIKSPIVANTIDDYRFKKFEFTQSRYNTKYLRIKYKGVLLPPTLPKGSKRSPDASKYSLGVFISNGKNYVCIRDLSELEEARNISGKIDAKIVFNA